VLVARELLKDSQFPTIARDLPEPVKYNLLWATKDANQILNSKISWAFMEMNIRMAIKHKPWLSPIIYNRLHSFA